MVSHVFSDTRKTASEYFLLLGSASMSMATWRESDSFIIIQKTLIKVTVET